MLICSKLLGVIGSSKCCKVIGQNISFVLVVGTVIPLDFKMGMRRKRLSPENLLIFLQAADS